MNPDERCCHRPQGPRCIFAKRILAACCIAAAAVGTSIFGIVVILHIVTFLLN